MRFRLNKRQKELLAPGLIELANISFAALIFGTILSDHPSWSIAIVGIALYTVLILFALYLRKGEQ
mgnify:CR=1 FL=1